MADINVKLRVDASGAIDSIDSVRGQVRGVNVEMKGMGSMGIQLNRIFEYAFGQILQRVLTTAIAKLSEFRKQVIGLAGDIEDVDSQFSAVFRNIRGEADAFIERFRRVTGFTTTESRKMASEIAGIALSLGETDKTALQLTESAALLALQWERIAGQPIAEGQRLIARALTGQIMELQRLGIISREVTTTQFQQLTLQQRLDVVAKGLAARYGDLSEATDGITQRQRQINGALLETRDTIIRQIMPRYVDMLEAVQKWLDGNQELLSVLGLVVGDALVDLFNVLGRVADRTDETGESTQRLTGVIGTAIEFIWALRRAYLGWVWGITQVRLGIAKLLAQLPLSQKQNEAYKQSIIDIQEELRQLGTRMNEQLIREQEYRETIRRNREAREQLEKAELRYGVTADIVGQKISDLTILTQEMIDEILGFQDTIDVIDNFVDAFEVAEDVLARFNKHGGVSINEIDEAIAGLNETIMSTTDPALRQGYIDMRKELEAIRSATLGAKESTDEFAIFLQTTMANSLANILQDFTTLFERIGQGSEAMKDAVLKSLLAVIRGIGHQLIAWGTAQLIMTAGADARGWAAIAYGTTLSGLSSLAVGAMQSRGTIRGSSHGGQSRRGGISSPVGNVSTAVTQYQGISIPDHITIDVTSAIAGEDIYLSGQRVIHLRNRIGNV